MNELTDDDDEVVVVMTVPISALIDNVSGVTYRTLPPTVSPFSLVLLRKEAWLEILLLVVLFVQRRRSRRGREFPNRRLLFSHAISPL